jgi:hypothetical protein
MSAAYVPAASVPLGV